MSEDSVDNELQEFILTETQKQRFQVLVHLLTSNCWDTCMERPSSKLEARTEICLMNCVERFIDTTAFVTRRLMNTTKYKAESPLQF